MKTYKIIITIFALLFFVLTAFNFIYAEEKKEDKGKISGFDLVNSDIDIEGIIDKLTELERRKGDKYYQEITNINVKMEVIDKLDRKLKDLKDISKSLYDYRSPFKDRKGFSEDENVAQIIPLRGADIGTHEIKVIQVAKNDIISSDSFPKDLYFKPCSFKIRVGTNSVVVDFKGGKAEELVATIKKQANDLVDAKIIQDTSSTYKLIISSKLFGSQNTMSLDGDIQQFIEIGLLKSQEKKQKVYDITLDFSKISWQKVDGFFEEVETKDEGKTIRLNRLSALYYSLPQPINIEDNTVLEFYFDTEKLQLSYTSEVKIGEMEPVQVSDVTVHGSFLISSFQEVQQYEKLSEDYLKLVFSDNTEYKIFPAYGTNTYSLRDYSGKLLTGIEVLNGDGGSIDTYSNIRIFLEKVEEMKGAVGKNYLSRASDAVFEIDGVKVIRDSNSITNVIPNTVLKLISTSTKPIQLRIDYDYDGTKERIKKFVEVYNDTMYYLYITTKPIVDRRKLWEKPEEEREKAIFATDMSIVRLRDNLRMAIMNKYPTRYGNNLALLSQIGIFTKNFGEIDFESSEWELTRMGILNIETEKLESALHSMFEGIEELFGNDTNNDGIKDTGVAIRIADEIDRYVGAGKILSLKRRALETQKKEQEKLAKSWEERTEEYRESLVRKYSGMSEKLRTLKGEQKYLENFTKSLNKEEQK